MEPHIFISYKTEEVEYADQLRSVLERIGYNVWWDREIQTGRAWHDEIDRQLKSAACVIVLWSKRAVDSKWVTHEAAHAIARDIYIPVRIELADVPVPYNHIQAATLTGWDGRLNTSEFPQLYARIAEVVGEKVNKELSLEGFTPWPDTVHRSRILRLWSWLYANSLGVIAILAATVAIVAVSISLNRQIGKLDKATNDINAKVAAANDSLVEAQRAINRTLYPLTSMKVSYFLRPDWNQKRFRDCFDGVQKQHYQDPESFGRNTCMDKDRLLRNTLCQIDVTLSFFKNRIDPITFAYNEPSSQIKEDLRVRLINPHSSSIFDPLNPEKSQSLLMDYRVVNGEVKRLELEVSDQSMDSTSDGWQSNATISSVYDLLGSQLIIQLDSSRFQPDSPVNFEEAMALRKTVTLTELVIRVSSGITMAFDADNLEEYVGPSGYSYYVFDFPTSMPQLSSATRYDQFKRLQNDDK